MAWRDHSKDYCVTGTFTQNTLAAKPKLGAARNGDGFETQ